MIPKFRAWDKKYKMIMTVNEIDFEKNTVWIEVDNGDHENRHTLTRDFDEVVLMQSTGLKDKNGVEIYQDDVVNMCWSDEIGESHWGKITIKNPFDYCIEEARYLIHADELEVIGNIHENPELLEENDGQN